eukprot:GFKZ01001158.1.p1 GENE.GFKZ01001158.1~~GFKZ01001158.1.p1  ORF type:complete len:658 (-),score=77.38 GFKZ01001158.1:2765-4672(-)
MLPVLITLAVLLRLLYRLLRPAPSQSLNLDDTKPSALEKIKSEAFEHTALSPPSAPRIIILYGTEYGFSREVAKKLASTLALGGFCPRVVNALHYRLIDFTRERFLAFVCSTTGDGAPPNEATELRDALVGKDVVIPPNCGFAVLALGDRAYPRFCSAGAEFDGLLGSNRLLERVNVDQEDWQVIDEWIASFEKIVKQSMQEQNEENGLSDTDSDYLIGAMEKYAESLENRTGAFFSRNNPYKATVVERRLLTVPRSRSEVDKEVIRVEFDISGSGITYESGDALGIVPRNNSEHVDRLLRAMASNGDEMVWVSDASEPVPLEKALTEMLDLRTVKPELVAKLATISTDKEERALGKQILGYDVKEEGRPTGTVSEWGKRYLAEREVLDVVGDFGTTAVGVQELVDDMRSLHARYYSISSTPVTSPERIAVTVDVLRYHTLNVAREGVASTFLKDRCRVGHSEVGVFISKNPNFRLPEKTSTPIIMIGPGTGIAPFIGFIEQRLAERASDETGCGENWLFFGCRHELQDFLYAEQLRSFAKDGTIVLHTAFSRDTDQKVYVQHRMAAQSEALWQIIEKRGGHVYVCGDGGKMARDVDAALQRIVQQQGGKSEKEAEHYIRQLAEARRYQRDVWIS